MADTMTVGHRYQVAPAIPSRLWFRAGMAFLALGACTHMARSVAGPDDWWLHGTWCLAGLLIALPTLAGAFRYGFRLVLTDHRLMFLLAFAVYFLFGGALMAVGSEDQIERAMSIYPIDALGALRVDVLNSLGFGMALVAAAFTRGRWLGAITDGVARQVGRVRADLVVAAFLAVGGFAALSVAQASLDAPVSGISRTLEGMSLAAVLVAASHRGRGEAWLRAVGIALAAALSAIGLLGLSKGNTLMPLVVLTVGLALRFRPRPVLLVAVPVLVITLLPLGNLVDYGRSEIPLTIVGDVPVSDRINTLSEGWDRSRDLPADEGYSFWNRFCNVPVEVATMDLRDAGDGGAGISRMFWAFVPRFLVPEKPVLTIGDELHWKLTGTDTSHDALGVFASGYYHGGWVGFIVASLLSGWIVAQTSAVARAIESRGALLMLPFSLFGVQIASQVAGDFIPNYMGAFVFVLYPMLAAALFLAAARGLAPRVPPLRAGLGA